MKPLMILAVLLSPAAVLAQTEADPGPSYRGVPLSPLFAVLATVVTALLGWLGRKLASANEAAKEASKAQLALTRLGAIAFAMVGDLWTDFSREFQVRIADGKIDADDRLAFRALVDAKVEKYTSREELGKLAAALNLPMPGVIAWLAEWAIDRLTAAHDPDVPAVSSGAYPVSPEPEPTGG